MPFTLDLDQLKDVVLFKGLTNEQLSQLRPLLHCQTFHAGATLMTMEQPGDSVYVILGGTVKVYLEREDGTEVTLAILGTADVVGEMSLIDDTGRCANVTTLEQTTALWMDKTAFNECLKTVPAITYNLLHVLTTRLRLANEQIQALAAMEVESRVARQLLAFARRYGTTTATGDILISLRLTQNDLANLVGASRERINQVMVSYKERKYLSVDSNHHVIIHNQSAMANRCK